MGVSHIVSISPLTVAIFIGSSHFCSSSFCSCGRIGFALVFPQYQLNALRSVRETGFDSMLPRRSARLATQRVSNLRGFLEIGLEIQCPVCQGVADPQGCCPPDAVHGCPEDIKIDVDADWFKRQCHINGVEIPAYRGCGVCTVCVEEITVDSSIEVPCCH